MSAATERSNAPGLAGFTSEQTQLLLGLAFFAGALVLLPVLVVALPLCALWSRARTPWWLVLALATAAGGLTALVRPVSVDGYLALLLALVRDAAPAVQASDWPALRALLPGYALAFAPAALTAGPPLAAALCLRRWWWPGADRPDRSVRHVPSPEGEDGKRTDGRTTPGAAQPGWLTGEDFAVLAGEPAPALWGACLEEGSVTVLTGAEKTGKSLLIAGLVGATVAGHGAYLGWPLRPAAGGEPVVLLAEESPQVFRHKALQMAGLQARALSWHGRLRWRLKRALSPQKRGGADIYVRSGPLVERGIERLRDHVMAGAQQALTVGARLLVVDSIKHWAAEAITQDEAASKLMAAATDAAALTRRTGPWPWSRTQGLIVVLIHHLNKNGEWLGPTTIRSQASFLATYTPPEGTPVTRTTERVLTFQGRFPLEAPAPLHGWLDLDTGGLRATADAPQLAAPAPIVPVAVPVPAAPPPPDPVLAWFAGQTDAEAWVPSSAVVEAKPGGLARTPVMHRLEELRESGGLEWQKQGNAYRYRLPRPAP